MTRPCWTPQLIFIIFELATLTLTHCVGSASQLANQLVSRSDHLALQSRQMISGFFPQQTLFSTRCLVKVCKCGMVMVTVSGDEGDSGRKRRLSGEALRTSWKSQRLHGGGGWEGGGGRRRLRAGWLEENVGSGAQTEAELCDEWVKSVAMVEAPEKK